MILTDIFEVIRKFYNSTVREILTIKSKQDKGGIIDQKDKIHL